MQAGIYGASALEAAGLAEEYKIVRELGKGTAATVWLAAHRKSLQLVRYHVFNGHESC